MWKLNSKTITTEYADKNLLKLYWSPWILAQANRFAQSENFCYSVSLQYFVKTYKCELDGKIRSYQVLPVPVWKSANIVCPHESSSWSSLRAAKGIKLHELPVSLHGEKDFPELHFIPQLYQDEIHHPGSLRRKVATLPLVSSLPPSPSSDTMKLQFE